MAKKEDRKKQKKRLKEHKKAASHAKYVAAKAKAERYPEIVFDPTEGNGYFVAEVRKAVKDLDFDSTEMGPEWMREFYKRHRVDGFDAARRWLEDLEERTLPMIPRTYIRPVNDEKYPSFHIAPLHLGTRIFARIPIETRRRFLPMNDCLVKPEKHHLLIRFSSLLEEPGEWGTTYYSRLMPKVDVDGKRVTVGFSTHAIEQVCARRRPDYLSYGANGDAHAYLAKCVFHEVVTLENGSQIIRLWDYCDNEATTMYDEYVLGVFGEQNRKPYGGRCHYVLGYCPFVVENGFAKAKSFLYPGYRGTPERALLKNAAGPEARYTTWLDEAEDENAEPFFKTGRAIEVAKWFHDHGALQVVQMTHEVLRLT